MKITWTLLALSLLMACNKENNDSDNEKVSVTDAVWQLSESKENNQEKTYPLAVKGDFDNDGTEETLARNDFYIFEDGWTFRAYSYAVINDEGTNVTTLQQRAGHLYAAAASPYTLNEDKISVFLKDYAIILGDSTLKLISENHELLCKSVQTIDRDEVKNAPLEPEGADN